MDKTYRKSLSLGSLPRMRKQNASLKIACKSTELAHIYSRFVNVCKCGEQIVLQCVHTISNDKSCYINKIEYTGKICIELNMKDIVLST